MEAILNQQAMQLVRMVDDLGLNRPTTRYRFMDDDEYEVLLSRDVGDGMQVYWAEVLARAHIASVTAVLRSRHWLSGVHSAYSDRNALAVAASFRGLLESAADAATSLTHIPLTLADLHSTISESLLGRARDVVISSQLEDELIHYSHGRYIKPSERASTPPSHRARSTQEYLKAFGDLRADKIAQCYRFLCDLTHPGTPSVWMWFGPADSAVPEFTISTGQDEYIISSFLDEYATVPLDVLMLAFNAPVLVLKTLNYFPIKDLHTSGLLSWNLDGIAAWTRCRSVLEARSAQVKASAR